MNYFVTAIGTDSGKTLASAILVEALQADYFKPIQCGTETIDSETVETLINNDYCRIFPSQFTFVTPVSPHQASKVEQIHLKVSDIVLPETTNTLIIEGAGGLLVPINHEGDTIADIIETISCEVVLIINIYLGCINHSLLTINELKRRGLKVKGIIFNGESNHESENIILEHSGYKKLLHIEREKTVSQEMVKKNAIKLMSVFYDEE